MDNLTIYGLDNTICHTEAMGLSKCFSAYAEVNAGYIEAIGFNANSGYTYIALADGISICSYLGERVQYLVTNFDNGDEYFFDNYRDAINKLESL